MSFSLVELDLTRAVGTDNLRCPSVLTAKKKGPFTYASGGIGVIWAAV